MDLDTPINHATYHEIIKSMFIRSICSYCKITSHILKQIGRRIVVGFFFRSSGLAARLGYLQENISASRNRVPHLNLNSKFRIIFKTVNYKGRVSNIRIRKVASSLPQLFGLQKLFFVVAFCVCECVCVLYRQ